MVSVEPFHARTEATSENITLGLAATASSALGALLGRLSTRNAPPFDQLVGVWLCCVKGGNEVASQRCLLPCSGNLEKPPPAVVILAPLLALVFRLLRAIHAGFVWYDPADSIYANGKPKVRPQWRTGSRLLEQTMRSFIRMSGALRSKVHPRSATTHR